jgi:3-oxoacyl-(acyl-carrier-protein) synthase
MDTSVSLTGCGWVTPMAVGGVDDVLTAALHTGGAASREPGRWGISDDLLENAAGLSGELKRDRGAWMTGIAFLHACRDASLDVASVPSERVGLVLGSALAGQLGMIRFANEVREQSPRFVSPIHFPQTVGNYVSGALSRSFNIKGPNITLATGGASGLDALMEACAALSAGVVDVVIAGGTDEVSEELSRGLGDPGMVLSEGACLFVLERSEAARARGVCSRATITDCGRLNSGEGLHRGRSGGIVSCGSCLEPGGIFIEHWTGRSFGSSGAAAAAAALGAAKGRIVPMIERVDPLTIQTGPVSPEGGADESRIRAVVCAEADGAHTTMIELAIVKDA